MAEKHHYKGLTDTQVLESRAKHGENSLSSVEGEPRNLLTLLSLFCW